MAAIGSLLQLCAEAGASHKGSIEGCMLFHRMFIRSMLIGGMMFRSICLRCLSMVADIMADHYMQWHFHFMPGAVCGNDGDVHILRRAIRRRTFKAQLLWIKRQP